MKHKHKYKYLITRKQEKLIFYIGVVVTAIIFSFLSYNHFFIHTIFESYHSYKALVIDSFLQYFCRIDYEVLNCKTYAQVENYSFLRAFLYTNSAEEGLIRYFVNGGIQPKAIKEFQYFDEMKKYLLNKDFNDLEKGVISYKWLQDVHISGETPPIAKLILNFKDEVILCKMDSITEIDIPESTYFPPTYSTVSSNESIRDSFSRIEELKYGKFFLVVLCKSRLFRNFLLSILSI